MKDHKRNDCQTLIPSGDYRSLIFWFLLVDLRHWTPVTAQSKEPLSVSIRKTKDTKEGGQKGIFLAFSRPQLAQANIWLTWAIK